MDDVFKALADPSRRRLLDSLDARAGQNLRELCDGLEMARQSVSKHLALLEAANLVTTVRRGREKLHYLNTAPINEIYERWINHFDRPRATALGELKRALEDSSMDKPDFVYTTYIHATPEQVWQALTERAFTRRYWGMEFETDWQAGSTYTLHQKGLEISDPEQLILESQPYTRLAYAWHTFTPEWAEAIGVGDDFIERVAGERRSKVTFELEPEGDSVKLTVIHDELEADSPIPAMIGKGWPKVLAELKTLLETGR